MVCAVKFTRIHKNNQLLANFLRNAAYFSGTVNTVRQA